MTVSCRTRYAAAIAAATLFCSGSTGVARAQSAVQASTQLSTIPKGTLVRVVLLRALDSTSMDVGDKVRVRVAPDDASGLPKDCVFVGRVTEVMPATKSAPGVIDVYFGALERAGSPWQGVSLDLAVGKQPRVDETADLRVVGETQQQQQPDTKLIGYGAGAGALLGSLSRHGGRSFLRGGILGAGAGAIAAEARSKPRTTYQDVKLKAGTELTVTLNRPITVQSAVVID